MIRLGAVRRDFVDPLAFAGANGSELFALSPHCVGPATQQLLGLVGSRVGGGIKVDLVARITAQQVANRSAHQVQPFASCPKERADIR